MPLFVLMTKLSPDAMKDASSRRTVGRKWLDKVHAATPEVRFVAHYALMGPYDFMDIYEAPDIAVAHKVSLISRSEGAVSAESWQAITYEDHLRLLEEVQD